MSDTITQYCLKCGEYTEHTMENSTTQMDEEEVKVTTFTCNGCGKVVRVGEYPER